ncbi:L,D-transpeptidase [Pacificimonas sp. WHA3]|uniref:L,D-transpeptidase n=1 Tax=Pacificimonas pallii TaxID=2827236 RepID=A0ABS6SDV0_9SPHN|nr:L,D-transpeptidase [Pacificimonas pallii]MBV7256598.1 L,D-transpeptidase [Pacificimonas pallii]
MTKPFLPVPFAASLAATFALTFAALPSAAQTPLTSGTVEALVADLSPGDFIWAENAAPQGPVLIVISRPLQRAYVYRNGVPIGISTVSTGRKGHETPTGLFTVLQKRVEHYSNLYNNAPMPYMQRLTWGGVALHAGNLPGYPASHGCIRLPHEFARLLYGVTALGITVVITDADAVPRLAPEPGIFLNGRVSIPPAHQRGMTYWRPDLSPTGPVSIVVSAADRELHILRNGREIGRAPVELTGPGDATHAYVIQEGDTGIEWLEVQLLGRDRKLSDDAPLQFSTSRAFRKHLDTVLVPGTSVILTPDTLRGDSTGDPLTIMEAGNIEAPESED